MAVNTNKSKNRSWEIGDVVNVGFVKSLTVLEIKSIRDYLPDIYVLESSTGVRYEFIPHNGLTRIN